MGQLIRDRVKLLAWTLAFLAPVASMEIGRELRARWDDHQDYRVPTPEFAKAVAACDVSPLSDR